MYWFSCNLYRDLTHPTTAISHLPRHSPQQSVLLTHILGHHSLFPISGFLSPPFYQDPSGDKSPPPNCLPLPHPHVFLSSSSENRSSTGQPNRERDLASLFTEARGVSTTPPPSSTPRLFLRVPGLTTQLRLPRCRSISRI